MLCYNDDVNISNIKKAIGFAQKHTRNNISRESSIKVTSVSTKSWLDDDGKINATTFLFIVTEYGNMRNEKDKCQATIEEHFIIYTSW